MQRNDLHLAALAFGALSLAGLARPAHALSSDRDKTMNVKAGYSKVTQGNDKTPGIYFLKADAATPLVVITQGTMKATGSEATMYQRPTGAKGAGGSSSIQRVVITGKQAHLEQQQDKGGQMTANADRIDYDADTAIAVLTGNVVVVQQGSGTFNGEHMTYNTNTGEMESSDTTSHKPVTMTFEPKAKPEKAASAADGAKPAATSPAESNRPAKKDGTPGEQP
ncbi:MAG: lipopolysaccharide transport periplasmic protein LptA [Dokdonella sp.]|uniref:lipopolysaccharide transport periplasmic protein LptA n=1 Tax=Dokdonella sp. TaxID=2291710 RepID=UPI0032669547